VCAAQLHLHVHATVGPELLQDPRKGSYIKCLGADTYVKVIKKCLY